MGGTNPDGLPPMAKSGMPHASTGCVAASMAATRYKRSEKQHNARTVFGRADIPAAR